MIVRNKLLRNALANGSKQNEIVTSKCNFQVTRCCTGVLKIRCIYLQIMIKLFKGRSVNFN